MAATLEIPTGVTGLTATVSLFADGSDTAASSGTSLTEATNRKGYYTCSITGLSGFHYLEVLVSGSPVWTGWVKMATSGRCVAGDSQLLDQAGGVESGVTLREAQRIMLAVLAGKRSNAGSSSEQYDAAGSPGTARVVGNLDSDGNGTPTLTP
jgi:hypothetical protein